MSLDLESAQLGGDHFSHPWLALDREKPHICGNSERCNLFESLMMKLTVEVGGNLPLFFLQWTVRFLRGSHEVLIAVV